MSGALRDVAMLHAVAAMFASLQISSSSTGVSLQISTVVVVVVVVVLGY